MAWIKVKAKNRAGEDYMKIVWQNPPSEERVVPIVATLHIAPVTPITVTSVKSKTSNKAKSK